MPRLPSVSSSWTPVRAIAIALMDDAIGSTKRDLPHLNTDFNFLARYSHGLSGLLW